MEDLSQKIQQTSHHQEDTFNCEICFEPVNKKFQNSNRCIHPFCTNCMTRYIQVKLKDNVSDIKCPHETCNHSLDPLSFRPEIAHQLFDKWCHLLCESTALLCDGVYCPNSKCRELIMNECEDVDLKRCVCPACLEPFCFQCKALWHAGYTCEEARDGNDYDICLFCEKKGWTRCPKCKNAIERFDGCRIVECRCGTRFCHQCGKKVPFWARFSMAYIHCSS